MRAVGWALILLFFSNWAALASEQTDILQRIQPIGKLKIESALPETRDITTANKGREVYQQHCTVCHQNGLAGAPKFQNTNDWRARFTKEKIDGLVAVAIKGINAMPAKGTCNECTENDIKQAILYMVPSL